MNVWISSVRLLIRIKNVVLVVIIAALCAVWVNSYAQLTEVTADVTGLSEAYETLQSDNNKLNVQLASKIDLSKIQDIAINDYSMQSVSRNQISYISLDGADVAEVINHEETSNIFSELAKKVLNAIEYLG
jgi:cell division protein FtsL